MNPIPSEQPKPAHATGSDAPVASLAETLANKHKHQVRINRRAAAGGSNLIYPFMLIASTLVAAAFCLLYITKPVIITLQDSEIRVPDRVPDREANPAIPAATESVLEPEAAASSKWSAAHGRYEETNLRVQHVLNASTPDGDLSRILLDVPVVYASRQLRWTDVEVAQVRAIHARLADYHEQSRALRELGSGILAEWNALIGHSIPTADLRADSPSLPANQEDAAHLAPPDILDTTEVIEIQPSGP